MRRGSRTGHVARAGPIGRSFPGLRVFADSPAGQAIPSLDKLCVGEKDPAHNLCPVARRL